MPPTRWPAAHHFQGRLRPFFQSDFPLAGAQNFEPLTVERDGLVIFAFWKGEATEFGDSFWRGGRRHHGGSGVCHHILVGLDGAEKIAKNWVSATLFIQRDLSQNFFCEISLGRLNPQLSGRNC